MHTLVLHNSHNGLGTRPAWERNIYTNIIMHRLKDPPDGMHYERVDCILFFLEFSAYDDSAHKLCNQQFPSTPNHIGAIGSVMVAIVPPIREQFGYKLAEVVQTTY